MRATFSLLLVLAMVGLASAADAQSLKTFDVLDPTYNTYPVAINAAGQIAGMYQDTNLVVHGFLRDTDGTITPFDPPGAGTDRNHSTGVTGMTPSGQIVGYYFDVNMGRLTSHGFVRNADGTVITFDATADSIYTYAEAVNPAGQIAGVYQSANSGSHGFVRDSDGTITSYDVPGFFWQVEAINQSGQIAGSYLESDYSMHGFVRDSHGTITSFDVPGINLGGIGCGHCHGTLVTDMNQQGQLIGYYGGADGLEHIFLRQTNGTIVSFDLPNSIWTFASAINSAGQVAGSYLDTSFVYHNFLLDKNGTIYLFDVSGAINSAITDMNAAGHMIGSYTDAGHVVHGFVLVRGPLKAGG
jgi:hypothetical protein